MQFFFKAYQGFTCIFPQYSALFEIQQALRDVQVEESRKRDLACALHLQFKDWLYGDALLPFCFSADEI